jgi:hypothetical protein
METSCLFLCGRDLIILSYLDVLHTRLKKRLRETEIHFIIMADNSWKAAFVPIR